MQPYSLSTQPRIEGLRGYPMARVLPLSQIEMGTGRFKTKELFSLEDAHVQKLSYNRFTQSFQTENVFAH